MGLLFSIIFCHWLNVLQTLVEFITALFSVSPVGSPGSQMVKSLRVGCPLGEQAQFCTLWAQSGIM